MHSLILVHKQKIAREIFGVIEVGGGKEKCLPPIFYPLGSSSATKFLHVRCLIGAYYSSKLVGPAVKIGVRVLLLPV